VINPALAAYHASCTHVVVCAYNGAWGAMTWCRGLAQAELVLDYWRGRSSHNYKIVDAKEVRDA